MRVVASGRTLAEVAQEIDVPIVDAHHHLCFLSEGSYPWLEGPPRARYHGDDRPLRRDYTRAEYAADFDGLPLVDSVVIENGAADSLWEARRLDRECRSVCPSSQVAHVDLMATDLARQLDSLAELPSVKGVRDILNWHPDSFYSHRECAEIMDTPTWQAGFGRLADYGLSFDMQVYPSQLPQVAALARSHPETRIVLDHCGMPIGRDRRSMQAWRKALAGLAANPNVFVKLSAVGTNDHAWTLTSLAEVISTAITLFGCERSMFGSNFPVDSLYSSLAELYGAFWLITSDCSRSERLALFSRTATDFYRIPNRSHDQSVR